MIKKSISFILIIIILLIFYQIGANYFKKSHNIDYFYKNNNMVFKINEKYIKNKDNDYYLLKVNYKEKDFLFDTDNNFNKQIEIVESVNVYEENNLLCLALDYKNDSESSYPLCYEDDNLVSFSMVEKKYDFSAFMKKLKKSTYEDYKKLDKDTIPYDDISLNLGYLNEENILVYSYKRIVLLNKNRRDYFVFANYDVYKNNYGYQLGKFYIVPKLSSSPVLDEFIVYNIENGVQKDIDFSNSISKNYYINGEYENKLYIFDRSNLKQYSIDPIKMEVLEVANTEKEGINIVHGKKKDISVYELKKDVIFTFEFEDYRGLNYDEIYDNPRGKFIVIKKDNKYYKIYKEYLDNPILILNDSSVTNFKVEKEDVFYLKDTVIYKNNRYGIFPLVTRNEFKYNSENIFDVYIE